MTSEQRYLFDLNGYLHLKNVLSEDELHLAREAACRYINTPPEDLPKGFEVDGNRYVNGFAFDKALECLVFHPKTWPIILEFTDRRPRLSGGTLQVSMADNDHHAFRLHCAREDTGPESSHYEARNDRIFCDNFAAFHYLTDVHPGDGGLVVIPGSHKSEFDRPLNFFNNGTM
ncbi:MAG: phytanoyl-CoA dioxygenase family protein, partial [Planctomycetota bacterium]|nr:phytanoyl-CoA dioxygenase family protein [Planctomycetota bacterium]